MLICRSCPAWCPSRRVAAAAAAAAASSSMHTHCHTTAAVTDGSAARIPVACASNGCGKLCDFAGDDVADAKHKDFQCIKATNYPANKVEVLEKFPKKVELHFVEWKGAAWKGAAWKGVRCVYWMIREEGLPVQFAVQESDGLDRSSAGILHGRCNCTCLQQISSMPRC